MDPEVFHGGSPRLQTVNATEGLLHPAGGQGVPRRVSSVMWSVEDRLRELDRASISRQVISPVPAVMEHAWTADPPYAQLVNDSIASSCAAAGGRLIGLGCVSRQGWRRDLEQCVRLELRGIEVGSRQGDLDLDDPDLDGLWRECEQAGLCIFVHPVAGGRGVIRRSGLRLDMGLGMLTDTSLAATALVFGGVLERYPLLRVALAHGGGTFPWVYPRLRDLGGTVSDPAEGTRWDMLARRLYVDTLVLDVEHLTLLRHRFGDDRIVLGSDCPFLPTEMVGAIVRGSEDTAALLTDNALGWLGI
ncbi:amidohydrolase family protein [Nocardioides sp. QY071]|nr:amidohydrolase family protein [Nocardioides sp. QY071]WGY00474.1 amidohydrolase family protein [Nocardioides sp. QY071]